MLAVYLAGIVPAIAQNALQEQPKLEFVLEELVTLGPSVHPGQTALGERNIVPITGERSPVRIFGARSCQGAGTGN
jgi:hypothetical protein